MEVGRGHKYWTGILQLCSIKLGIEIPRAYRAPRCQDATNLDALTYITKVIAYEQLVSFVDVCGTVESNKGDGQLSACEVLLFHHEDMGIPREIAKFGIGKGMWGAVKKIEPGLRAYQKSRAFTTASLSRCAFMAQLNTKLSADYLRSLEVETINSQSDTPAEAVETLDSNDEKPSKTTCKNIPKLLIVGGALVLACSLDRGLLTKTVVSGVVTGLFKIGRRL
ncbi:hypothetical protein C5167_027575 [Papaver somniferum]|nr:hypothetical protein C5167_027575 [Papaver somniferum]